MKVKRAGQRGAFSSKFLNSGGSRLGAVACAPRANTLKEKSLPLSNPFNFEWDTSRFKAGGGSRLDSACNLILSYFPVARQEVKRTGQAWWRSSKFLTLRGPTKS